MSDPMLIRQTRGEVHRATGHRYAALEKACESMEPEALRDLVRLIQK